MPEPAALVIAAHGTRARPGVDAALELVDRVRALLPGVDVTAGFVELTPPTIDVALADALARMDDPRAVVVPLMIGTGGHVRRDIPEAIEAGAQTRPDAAVAYSAHLGPDPRLIARVLHQIDEARGDWPASETTVVFTGRGALVPEANGDHLRLSRLVAEAGGYASVEPCFIQVVEPSLPSGLERAWQTGARRIVVMPHFLFPGRLRTWTHERSARWLEGHPEVELRVAEVIGPCDELAEVVADRYRAAAPDGAPVYLSGLVLRGRDVVVVGGGKVAARRVPVLLAAGAVVTVVTPDAHPDIEALADAGRVRLERRGYEPGDCSGAWYVLALTDDAAVNEAVVAEAEANHTFVVRGDDAAAGSAYTPATARAGGLTVGVVGDRNPIRSARVRDGLVAALSSRHVQSR